MHRHKHPHRGKREKKAFEASCKWAGAAYFPDLKHCRLGYRSCSGKRQCISRKIKGRGFQWK